MSMFKRLMSSAAVLTAGMTLLAAPSQAGELKYKFEKGQTVKYRVTNDTNADMDMAGQAMKQSVNMVMEMSLLVKEVAEDGSATLEAKYTSAKMDMDVPMAGKMSYDSSKKEGNSPMLESMGAMLDKPFTVVLATNGQVKELKGLAEMMGGNPMGSMFGEEQMKANFEQSFYVLPDAKVESGGTWTRTSSQGPMKFENTYTLKSMDGAVATIESVGKVSLAEKEQMGMTMELEQGKANSTITFDTAKGQITRSEGTGDFTLKMSGQGQNITTKAKSKTVTERID